MQISRLIDITGDGDTGDSSFKFSAEEWLCKGKTYSSALPNAIHKEVNKLLEIPAQFNAFIPKADLAVADLLSSHLPTITSSLVNFQVASFFSKETPREDEVRHLFTRQVPDLDFLRKLRYALGQAWFDGHISINDVRHRNSTLPIWVIAFWELLGHAINGQKQWRICTRWIQQQLVNLSDELKPTLLHAEALSRRLAWDAPLRISGASGQRMNTLKLTTFLSNTCLTDSHMDIAIRHIALQLRRDTELRRKILLCTLSFSQLINFVTSKDTYKEPSRYLVKIYEDILFSLEGPTVLTGPVFLEVAGAQPGAIGHWIAFKVDFLKREISYGDSLPSKTYDAARQEFVSKLGWWLQSRSPGRKFRNIGNQMPHGQQQDGFSCGICTLNTLQHFIFGKALWSDNRKDLERAEWFNIFARQHLASNGDSTLVLPQEMPVPSDETDVSYSLAHEDHNVAFLSELRGRESSSNTSILVEDDEMVPAPEHANTNSQRLTLPTFTVASEEPDSEHSETATILEDHVNKIDSFAAFNDSDDILDDILIGNDSEPSVSKAQEFNIPDLPPSLVVPELAPERVVESSELTQQNLPSVQLPKDTFKRIISNAQNLYDYFKSKDHRDLTVDAFIEIRASVPRPRPPTTRRKRKRSRKAKQTKAYKLFIVDDIKMARFEVKLAMIDPHAFVHPDNPCEVRCFKCGEYKKLQKPYKILHFKKHYAECKGPKKTKLAGAGMKTLHSYFLLKENIINTAEEPVKMPCSGLKADKYKDIDNYLKRTGVAGGGSMSITGIAKELFKKPFRNLKPRQREIVFDAQVQRQTWKNDFERMTVHSTKCLKEIRSSPRMPDKTTCLHCLLLMRNKNFYNAIKRKAPPNDRRKFTPMRFRPKGLAELYLKTVGLQDLLESSANKGKSPCVRFAQGVLAGEYKDYKVFIGLMEAVVLSKERAARGVGRQNFPHAPEWAELAQQICLASPQAYKLLEKHLPAPSVRYFQKVRQKRPRFPISVCERTFKKVAELLEKLNYDGPCALSCDDTKLQAAFRPYFDPDRNSFVILGSTGEPMLIPNIRALKDILKSANLQKATKLRLWVLQVEIAGIPPIIVAAKSIPETNNADTLFEYTNDILVGLINSGVRVTSYSCDGTVVERNVQLRLLQHYNETSKTHNIPLPSGAVFCVEYVSINGQAVVMVQDSKHALKTYRNNLTSGARLLVFGNFILLFQFLIIMEALGCPMYHRDIWRPDKQDDAAATRQFSSGVLQWICEHLEEYPEFRGLVVYLFVFGDIVDAFQSRTMSHYQRAKIALRTSCFLDLWLRFLDVCGYDRNRYCISRDAIAITRILVNGLLGLIYIHRDFPNGRKPLLPWLHSSEACEHVFGLARQTVTDFTHADFIQMIPKLEVKLQAIINQAIIPEGNERATGYMHTYFDNSDANINNLAIFPTDEEMCEIAQAAFEEASDLFSMLDVSSTQILEANPLPRLPSIASWANIVNLTDDVHDDESVISEDDELDTPSLLNLLEIEVNERGATHSRATSKALEELSCAAVTLSLDDAVKINALPELDEATLEQTLEINRKLIADSIVPLELPDERDRFNRIQAAAASKIIDYEQLVLQRRQNQTKQAEKGIRKRAPVNGNNSLDIEDKGDISVRAQLVKRFYEIIRDDDEERGTSTGLNRRNRWTSSTAVSNPGYTPSENSATGNSANAAEVAARAAKNLLTQRSNVWRRAGMPAFSDARITLSGIHIIPPGTSTPPTATSFGFVYVDKKIMLAKVYAMYKKGGGKGGKHCNIDRETNICSLSYLAVQLFEYSFGRQFRLLPEAVSPYGVAQYMLLPSSSFLCVLRIVPLARISATSSSLEISPQDYEIFLQTTEHRSHRANAVVLRTMQTFNKKKNTKNNAADNGLDFAEDE